MQPSSPAVHSSALGLDIDPRSVWGYLIMSLLLLPGVPTLAQSPSCTSSWVNAQTCHSTYLSSSHGSASSMTSSNQPSVDFDAIPVSENAQLANSQKRYRQIKRGMSLKQVLEIVGTPPSYKSTGTTYHWIWSYPEGTEELTVTLSQGSMTFGANSSGVQKSSTQEKFRQLSALEQPITLEQIERIAGRSPDTQETLYELSWTTTDRKYLSIRFNGAGNVIDMTLF